MTNLEHARELVDQLREQRRLPGSTAEGGRPILEELEDLWELMTDEEHEELEREGWRAWPDLFDAHVK